MTSTLKDTQPLSPSSTEGARQRSPKPVSQVQLPSDYIGHGSSTTLLRGRLRTEQRASRGLPKHRDPELGARPVG